MTLNRLQCACSRDEADVYGFRADLRAPVHGVRISSRPMKKLAPMLLVAALASTQVACYGSYGAFHAVHRWNGTATGNKVANSVIHFGLWVLPVYELSLLGDFLIFNNIEFLTGSRVFR
jgi:hypothetical protein